MVHGEKQVRPVEAWHVDYRAALQQAGTQVHQQTEHVVAGYQPQNCVAA